MYCVYHTYGMQMIKKLMKIDDEMHMIFNKKQRGVRELCISYIWLAKYCVKLTSSLWSR